MSSDLDVFVGNTTLIDEEVYRLWLDGHSVAEAVARRLRGGVLEREGTSVAVLQSDTRDHYRTFQMLERLLHAPPRLLQQLLFQIPPERQALLIQRYYAFDEALARELLGKKLSKGTKKELDEVSARTGVGIRSCRRQGLRRHRVLRQQPLRDGQTAAAVPELRRLRRLRPEPDGPLEPGGPGARGGRARRGPAQVLPAGPEGAEGARGRQGPAGPAQEPGVLGPAGEDLGPQRAGGQLQGAVPGPGERRGEVDPRPRRSGFLRGPGGEGDRALPLRQVEPGGPAALPDALHGGTPKPAGLQAPGAVGALHGRHQRLPAAHVPRLSRERRPKNGHGTPKTAWTREWTQPHKQHPKNGHSAPKTAWTWERTQPHKQRPKNGMDLGMDTAPQTAPQKPGPQKRTQPHKQRPKNRHGLGTAPQKWTQPKNGHSPTNSAPKTGTAPEWTHPHKQHPKNGHGPGTVPQKRPGMDKTPQKVPQKPGPQKWTWPRKQHPKNGHSPKMSTAPKTAPQKRTQPPKRGAPGEGKDPGAAAQNSDTPKIGVPNVGPQKGAGLPKTRQDGGSAPRNLGFGEPRAPGHPKCGGSRRGNAPNIGTFGMGRTPKKG
nr:acidic fibroblast growth factor intracellular-binding protein isoform X2 [Taeniopygia guttata]